MINKKMMNFAAGIILLIGALPLSYNYYIVLRFSIFIVAGINLISYYILYRDKKEINPILLLFMLSAFIIFNPIMPIYMNKSTWIIFDVIFGISFIGQSIYENINNEKNDST